MPEIRHQELDGFLKKTDDKDLPLVFLIHGEEYLYKTAMKILTSRLVPEAARNTNLELLDGENENIPRAIEQVNTYSLLSDGKVVVIQDSRIFVSRQGADKILGKIRDAFRENNPKKAAGYFTGFLGNLNMDFSDLDGKDKYAILGPGVLDESDDDWIGKLIEYCKEEGRSVSSAGNQAERLAGAVERGFPGGNRLVITTDIVDKRRQLYKKIKETGLIIDCSVSKGARKADKDEQNAVLYENFKTALDKAGKTMDPPAYKLLYEKTGFDLRTFMSNLEKLIDFAGTRERITSADVETVLSRTKADPVFELTNALSGKDPEKTLFYLNSLLSSEYHPLQILAAMTNQVRRLSVCRSACDALGPRFCHGNVSFNEFKSKILPRFVDEDHALQNVFQEWEGMMKNKEEEGKEEKKKAGKKTVKKKHAASDVYLVKNPNNPFPVYQLMKSTLKYSRDELVNAMEHLNAADRLLKTSPEDPKLILEKAVFNILINTSP
jgi:DNA polymerase III subunit delta